VFGVITFVIILAVMLYTIITYTILNKRTDAKLCQISREARKLPKRVAWPYHMNMQGIYSLTGSEFFERIDTNMTTDFVFMVKRDGCSTCDSMLPTFKQAAEEMEAIAVLLDIEEFTEEEFDRFGVAMVPTIGRCVNRQIELLPGLPDKDTIVKYGELTPLDEPLLE
jgi:hypothetical protein